MSHHQYKLFEYTKANDLLIGDAVINADRTRHIVKSLQSQKKMAENWRLDIFCRDPSAITNVIVTAIDPTSAAASYGKYDISIVIRDYTLSVAYFKTKGEAQKMLNTIRAYITLRYGVKSI